jgi:myo-inositol-1(or 4)-monophosphatase
LLRRQQKDVLNVRLKRVADLVTDADFASERLIAERIEEAFPDDHLLAEEGTETQSAASAERCWIVDPLDGTTNYAHGYPLYAVSIALEVQGIVEVGVVYVPVLDEMFAAVRGRGATLNDEPIGVSETDALIDSMLATGFAYDVAVRSENQPSWAAFVTDAQAVRRDGAAALDLCYVACGRYDGFWERELSPWDVAAGALIMAEAGGLVTDYRGGESDIYAREVVASNGLIHGHMLEVLAKTH